MGINLDVLREDVRWLKARYGLDERGKSEGRVVIRCVGLGNCQRYGS
jgi:6-phosphofructokinase 1